MVVVVVVVVTLIMVYGPGHGVMLLHVVITLLVQGVCGVGRRYGSRTRYTHTDTQIPGMLSFPCPLIPFSARLPEFLPRTKKDLPIRVKSNLHWVQIIPPA